MKIVVLAGGLSTERDVSITSGMQVSSALRKNGHKTVLLDVYMGYNDPIDDIDALFDNGYDFTKSTSISHSIPDLDEIKKQRCYSADCFFGQKCNRNLSACGYLLFGTARRLG